MVTGRQNSRSRAGASTRGSIVVWLAGLVLGVGVGVVLAYHMVQTSRMGELPDGAVETRASAGVIERAHEEALRKARSGSSAGRLGDKTPE